MIEVPLPPIGDSRPGAWNEAAACGASNARSPASFFGGPKWYVEVETYRRAFEAPPLVLDSLQKLSRDHDWYSAQNRQSYSA